ncbi:MAG: LysR family transcriptional regulator [Deltaproteobacteria bacterium]|nr:LysR family transcriptional regulator [Deltaproteobacteria bacterium]
MAVNWEDLRYILAVAQEGTIVAAARSLQVSPTTVSRRLRTLEETQGAKLFDKFKHGAILSEAGERVVSVAREVERMTDQLDAEIHGLDQRLVGPVRVSAVDFLLLAWMKDFGAFAARYPEVQLELASTMAVVNLTQREADVALRIARTAPEHLLGTRHAEVLYCVYGSVDLIEATGADAPYSAYPWLSWDLGVSRSTDTWIAENAAGASPVLRVGEMPVMCEAIEEGLGVTILPCIIGDANPRWRRIGDYFEGGLWVWVLTHPELRGSARIKAFTRTVRELIRRDKDLIEGRRPRPARAPELLERVPQEPPE